MGSPEAGPSAQGHAYVVFGKVDTSRVAVADIPVDGGGFAVIGDEPLGELGSAVAALGDLDADGFADFAVGAPYIGDYGGAVYVVSGKEDNTTVEASDLALGVGGYAFFGGTGSTTGFSIGGGGDVDGDGLLDLAIGARTFANAAGRMYVVFQTPGPDR